MATVQERPKTDGATDVVCDDLGTVTIHDLLEDGDYVSREHYTVAPQEEIADIIRKSVCAGARVVRPDWELMLEVERVDHRAGNDALRGRERSTGRGTLGVGTLAPPPQFSNRAVLIATGMVCATAIAVAMLAGLSELVG